MKQIYGLASEVCKSSRVQCLVESSPHTGWWHPFRHRGWAASLRISRSARGRLIAGGFANTCAFEPLLVDIWTETSTLLAWKQAVNIGQRTGPCPCAKAGTVDCGMGALHQRPSLIATCAGFKHPFQAPEGQLFFFCHVSRLHHPDERLHRCRVLRLDKLLGARLRGCWQAAGLTALQRAGIIHLSLQKSALFGRYKPAVRTYRICVLCRTGISRACNGHISCSASAGSASVVDACLSRL